MPAQPDAGAPCGRREPTVVELRQFGRDVADSTDSLVSRDSLDSSFQSPMKATSPAVSPSDSPASNTRQATRERSGIGSLDVGPAIGFSKDAHHQLRPYVSGSEGESDDGDDDDDDSDVGPGMVYTGSKKAPTYADFLASIASRTDTSPSSSEEEEEEEEAGADVAGTADDVGDPGSHSHTTVVICVMSNKDLQAELKSRGLSASGNKTEMAARLAKAVGHHTFGRDVEGKAIGGVI
jgi:hypothetical protein